MFRSSSSIQEDIFYPLDTTFKDKERFDYKFLPLYFTTRLDGKRPYVGGEYGLIPARGVQSFLSTGIKARFSILHVQFQPELVTAQNLTFPGFPDTFSSGTIAARFLYWNVGDSPERFGNGTYIKLFWGQSSISFREGAFELSAGTKNFWWGPGQWNSLIFSNNAPGFPHISLNTTKPAKTFLGHFEGQVLIGRLESSGFPGSQSEDLNTRFFKPLNPDWRYINAFMISYTPKWIPNLSLGMARSFLQYGEFVKPTFSGLLPMFEPFQKEKFFEDDDSFFGDYDTRQNDKSQQAIVFGRYVFVKGKGEIYFQFGRRDHAFNWREFTLNPEHARAYQFGFIKLANLSGPSRLLQIRGEITHQQESVNRYLRYNINGGISWHTHGDKRGFGHLGQPLGVGIGTGSNVQTLEVSVVEDWNKLGILFERLENNQDFYYRAFGQQGERKPWIDWSTALIWNTSYKDLFVSARLQGTYARNYQWGLSETSTPEFPVSQNLFSLHSQVNLIYFWNRSLKKKK
uniref:capsule assembly Wzi family protein n=1 Tax=Algoriphagus sp. TaxID=1872435 RepID=UPI004047CF99